MKHFLILYLLRKIEIDLSIKNNINFFSDNNISVCRKDLFFYFILL